MNPLTLHEEVDNPMPINSAYIGVLHGHGRGRGHHGHDTTHHDHNRHEPPHIILPSSSPPPPPPPHLILPPSNNNSNNAPTNTVEDHHQHQHQHQQSQGYNGNCFTEAKKKAVRYRECQKNHAASMGGNARDGCGEFMPSGEYGSFEALICSACNCHRNFHRKESEGEPHLIISPNNTSQFYPSTPHSTFMSGRGRTVILGSTAVASSQGHDHVNVVPFNMAFPPDQSRHHQMTKKRFRTKFSQEQKEKMMEFAERVGWKIQKQEEGVVQQFCKEIGVKRKVLKVWMHNNKHNLVNKTNIITNTNNNNSNSNNNSSSSM